MKIIKSNVRLDENLKYNLVQESSINYPNKQYLSKPEDIVEIMEKVFSLHTMAEEYLYLINLTNSCKPINFCEISHGTASSTIVGIREIMVRALLSGATNIVIVHNHPGGSPFPSEEDIVTTEKLSDAARLIGIKMEDHIIVAQDGYFSFRELSAIDM